MANTRSITLENSKGLEDIEIFGDDSGKIKTFAFTLNGIVTDILFCDYSDKQLMIITQFQKIGTLIFVTKGCSRSLNGISNVYDVKTIYGVDKQDYYVATRYLAEQLDITKPILFGICLKNVHVKTLKGIAKTLRENLQL